MLYLVQIPILCSLGIAAFLSTPISNYNARTLIALVIYSVASLFFADRLTRFIDRPCMILSHKISF